uniref:TIMELESS-interacting protein n=1 Tax=Glossina brevipalpis TaxID=37001 RepID=A0A1A9WKZ2_9MUSC
MSSLFGDEDDIGDLLNDDLHSNDNLPEDNEDDTQLFGNKDNDELIEDENNAAASGTKVETKKRLVRNPRLRLTVQTLSGLRGIQTIEDYFRNIEYKGKGYEKLDLDEIMQRLQHWAHRMYPTYKFDDVLSKIEQLGKKKPLQVHMSRYRLGMLESMKQMEESEKDGSEDEKEMEEVGEQLEVYDEFDALLDEQIAISKIAPRTPKANCSQYAHVESLNSSVFATPSFSKDHVLVSTPRTNTDHFNNTDNPLPQTRTSTEEITRELTSEQMARIAENRRLAQERLAKRLEQLARQPVES